MLIEPARTIGIPWIQLAGHSQMDEPIHLQRLPVCLRAMRRHDRAVLRDLQQLHTALRIALLFSELTRIFAVTRSQDHQRFTGSVHALQFFFALQRMRILEEIKPIDRLLNVPLIIEEPLFIDLR